MEDSPSNREAYVNFETLKFHRLTIGSCRDKLLPAIVDAYESYCAN